jgi:methyl-accepting chemotaxis protein PixJ
MSDNSGDIVIKIVEANALESAGKVAEAIALYQEISQLDPSGNYGNVAREALNKLQKSEDQSQKEATKVTSSASFWQKLNLKVKTTAIAICLTTIPIVGISSVAYYFAHKSLNKATIQTEQILASQMADKINRFMFERYGDVQVLAKLPVFTKAGASGQEKSSILDYYVATYGVYSHIAAFDVKGNVLFQSKGESLKNHLDRDYFQQALKTGEPVISSPKVAQSSGKMVIHFVAPIKANGATVGVMQTQMPVEYLENVLAGFDADAHEYHITDPSGKFFIALEKNQVGKIAQEDFPDLANILQAKKLASVSSIDLIDNAQQFVSYAPFGKLEGLAELHWGSIMAIDEDVVFASARQLRLIFILGTGVTTILVSITAVALTDRFLRPIINSAQTVAKLGEGDLSARIEVKGQDELAVLGSNINRMAGQIQDLLHIQEADAKQQRQEKERLQQGVMSLLLDVEGAKKGDLTVKAQMTDGAVGSIADAFNSTMSKLRELLQQVQSVSMEVGELSLAGEGSVRKLSESALQQTAEIDQALSSIGEINQSVATIANYAQEAAKIARSGSIQAKEGDLAMDATVSSIEKIRGTVANTSKKVKQLAESSQEIAQIVEIISGISEKTNLLAFNASVEAARAGEHGEGFRIVAEEVRRLADRITEATKDIQQLVNTIQQDTTLVLQGMETSTSEVVNGSELVRMTKINLRSLADTSKQIDEYLKYISTSTTDQTNTSLVVNQKISGIANASKINSTEAQNVVQSLQTLVSEAENLQSSIAQFKLEK